MEKRRRAVARREGDGEDPAVRVKGAYPPYLQNYREYRAKGRASVQERGFAPDLTLAGEIAGRSTDERYGVTVIARPPAALRAVISEIQSGLRSIDANQYFYPAEDLHLTVLEIFQSRPEPVEADQLRGIIARVRSACADVPPPRLVDGCLGFDENTVTLTCFPCDDRLDALRSSIASALAGAGLAPEPRYRQATSHVTFVRYLTEIRDARGWLAQLSEAQKVVHPVSWQVDRLFVTAGANWYGRSERVEVHGPLALKGSG